MARKKVLGIKVECPLWKNNAIQFHASFVIQEGVSSESFISSPEIRQAIQKYEEKHKIKPIGEKLGYITCGLDNFQTAAWKEYYPLGLDVQVFSNKGIASWLELIVLKDLKKKFPGIKNLRHAYPLIEIEQKRKEQLKKKRGSPATNTFLRKISGKIKERNNAEQGESKTKNSKKSKTKKNNKKSISRKSENKNLH